ncbi:MAG: UrcA family protein, partial [Gammaproteobacteria bacterium]
QETLYYRISSAARKVCGSSDFRRTGSVKQAAENKSCYESTLSQALSQTTASQVASTN